MGIFAALDVSQEQTAICFVASDGAIRVDGKVVTCPEAIASWLSPWKEDIERIGIETGPLAVWLWNALKPALPALSRIKVMETHDSGCVYAGPA